MSYEAVYLDRDGVINVELGDYVTRPADLRLEPGAAVAIRRLNDAGLPVAVVTNQAGIGRGRYTAADLAAVHARLVAELAAEGARIDGLWVCPHHPDDQCACRKPQPGLLLQAAEALGFDPRRAVLVGDRLSDLEVAQATGAASILVRTGYGDQTVGLLPGAPVQPAAVVADLAAAVDWILARCAT